MQYVKRVVFLQEPRHNKEKHYGNNCFNQQGTVIQIFMSFYAYIY